jgi:beta-lactamase class A
VGCHHDAWTFGAADPNAGTIVVLEAARAFAEAARRGRRPDRTVVFANWAAEEFGILGSTEWVEAHREELRRGAVAYVNLDSASVGLELTASASPSLKGLVADVAGALPQPRDPAGRTVLEAWRARAEDPQRAGRPLISDTGGGSDHVGFVAHVGVPVVGLGAQGSEGTAYHSAFDNLAWYRKVVGEDYESALLVTRVTSLVLARLATADILPLDPSAYGLEARRHIADIADRGRRGGIEADLVRADAAAQRFERRARRRLEEALARLDASALDETALARANEAVLRAERLWTAPEGVPERPWFRSLFAATDPDSGYAPWMLPALRWAIERRQAARVEPAERQLLGVFDRLEEALSGAAPLAESVDAAIAGFAGKVSLFAKNLDTGETFGVGADDPVRAASTIKVPIMVEAFARVEAGEASWTEALPLAEAGKAAGAGVLSELHDGLALTLRDAVHLMIVVSDNTATNLVLDRLTADAVNARMDSLGLGATRVLRKVGGGGESAALRDPAHRRFGLGVTTPREIVRLLEALERRQVVSPDASREMLEILKREQYGYGIGRTLRGESVASKWGALERLRSDVGIVYSERGRIAMAITCEGIPEIAWTVDNPGDVLIAQLSRVLVDGLGRPASRE